MAEAYIPQEIADEINELAYDILMCLRTGLPVNTINEYKLSCLLDDCDVDLSIMQCCPHLRELTEYFLDNGIDGAWNIGNMLIG